MIKQLIEYILSKTPYTLTKAGNIGFNSSYLSKISQPKTVFDIGVGYGTTPLYEAYPKAHFVLIEPLQYYQDPISKITKKYDCEVHFAAVGEKETQMEFNVDVENLQKSSFLHRTELTKANHTTLSETIKVTTLDRIFEINPNFEKPILLKIDTEGHEMSALRGAESLLKVTDTVIAEVSIAKRFENSYEFEDIVIFMKQRGFYVYSFLTMSSSGKEQRQRFADIVFKRR